jgi:hypothetical protein
MSHNLPSGARMMEMRDESNKSNRENPSSGNVKDIDADVDDFASEHKPVIERPAPPEFDQNHCNGLETIGTKMEEITLA